MIPLWSSDHPIEIIEENGTHIRYAAGFNRKQMFSQELTCSLQLTVFNHKKSTCATALEAIYQKIQWHRQTGGTRSFFPPAAGGMATNKCK